MGNTRVDPRQGVNARTVRMAAPLLGRSPSMRGKPGADEVGQGGVDPRMR